MPSWRLRTTVLTRGRIFSQAGNELGASSFPARNELSMLFPYTSFPAGYELILKLTKNTASGSVKCMLKEFKKHWVERAFQENFVKSDEITFYSKFTEKICEICNRANIASWCFKRLYPLPPHYLYPLLHTVCLIM